MSKVWLITGASRGIGDVAVSRGAGTMAPSVRIDSLWSVV